MAIVLHFEDVFPHAWDGFGDFLRFHLFFSPVAARGGSAVARAAGAQRQYQYRLGVGEGLKQRVFDALGSCIEVFSAHCPTSIAARDIEQCRRESLILLYPVALILFAEDRKLLPFGIDRAYTDNAPLGALFARISPKGWTTLRKAANRITRLTTPVSGPTCIR